MLVLAHHDRYSEIEHVHRGHFFGDQWLDDGPKVSKDMTKVYTCFKCLKTGSQFCSEICNWKTLSI